VEKISDEDADGTICRLLCPRAAASFHRMPLSQGNNDSLMLSNIQAKCTVKMKYETLNYSIQITQYTFSIFFSLLIPLLLNKVLKAQSHKNVGE
jgi:hypothetical protein